MILRASNLSQFLGKILGKLKQNSWKGSATLHFLANNHKIVYLERGRLPCKKDCTRMVLWTIDNFVQLFDHFFVGDDLTVNVESWRNLNLNPCPPRKAIRCSCHCQVLQ